MGVTTDQLNDMLKKGEVASEDFLPKFAKKLRETVRETGALEAGMDSLVATQNRFNNALFDFTTQTNKAGGEDGLKELFNDLTIAFNTLFGDPKQAGKRLKVILKGLGSILKTAAEILSPVVSVAGAMLDVVASTIAGEEAMEGLSQSSKDFAKTIKPVVGFFKVIAGLIQASLAGFQGLVEISKNMRGVETLVDPLTGAVTSVREIAPVLRDLQSLINAIPKINPLQGLSSVMGSKNFSALAGPIGILANSLMSSQPATNNIKVDVAVDGVSVPSVVETKENLASMGSI